MKNHTMIDNAKNTFETLIQQLKRIEQLKAQSEWIDYSKKETVVIGIVGEMDWKRNF